MHLHLLRTKLTPNETLGTMTVDGRHFCYTLEDAVRPIGQKIEGRTAIPAGPYTVIVSWSPRFKMQMPLLLGNDQFTKNWSGVRIHSGNSATDTEGCILVGYRTAGNELRDSMACYLALVEKLRAQDNISLEISNGLV